MESWIISGARTPIGRFLGDLSSFTAAQLGGLAISAAIDRSSLRRDLVDEVIMGQVLTAGAGQAPARQAAQHAGLSSSIGCVTINKVCGSGLYSVMMAERAIRCGDSKVVIAGGMESMSQAPHLISNARSGWKYGAQTVFDAIESDGLRCAQGNTLMGCYADQVAADHGIDRHMQDAWALQSHQRAIAAQQSGKFTNELLAITLHDGRVIAEDSGPRADTSLERLGTLRTAFDKTGTVTAGNASSLSDGAAAVVVVDDETKASLDPQAAFRIVASQVHAQEPKDLFLAPVGAIKRLLNKTARTAQDIDLFEINEAFASQTLACMRELQIPADKLNVQGGAIALGHPIGCSGTRVLVTLMHALLARQATTGIAALCLGGGEAVAMMIEVQ